ncbi:T9SS type A sorting domain-containing protein [Brumimicrobium glaciale]|uniref:T9SS type A sorting domain-containing protein n=1 Tax=Brumimicrobium glaciale TaxID=200475 RepID=A0A4Q4KKM8_9FLAO|nr:T9SS type A sorting domain-containing protein [Brumimicrobium glaciale]RYM33862.1 T9SS type A sorting domain-containing protein [Brumimicrobium glaciale]
MKKIYVMAAFLGATSFAFNQKAMNSPLPTKAQNSKAIAQTGNVEKALGASLYTNDFSTVTDWTVGTDEIQGSWVLGVAADLPNAPQYYAAINSTTKANGFAFFEGVQHLLNDPNPPVANQNAWVEMTTSIDLSGESFVTFTFQQRYRSFNSDITYVEVSLDGGVTWEQEIDVNDGVIEAGAPNISVDFAVNNSSTVKFRFRWNSMSANAGYAWQVDDVEIFALSDNDVEITANYKGTDGMYYHQIPLAQASPIAFEADVKGKGIAAQTNVKLQVSQVGGAYVGTSQAVSLDYGIADTLKVTPPFTPNAIGAYEMEFELLNDATDDMPTNNMIANYEFEVGQNIYARDNGIVNSQVDGLGYSTPLTVEPGVLYKVFADAELTAINVTFGDALDNGIQVFGKIYLATDVIGPGEIAETLPYVTTAADVEGTEVTLIFETPVQLTAGQEYVISAKAFEVNFSVLCAGESPLGTAFKFGALGAGGTEGWFVQPFTPMIRMNFDPSLGVENNELSNLNVSANFPNPFANETTVQFNLKEASTVSYKVIDMTGKVMTEVSEGNTMAGDHQITIDGTSFANGVYYLNITAGETSVTRKMIVNK